ncbi:MAG: hypothetical protein ABR905_22860, partial [Terracidiphilus sp.]
MNRTLRRGVLIAVLAGGCLPLPGRGGAQSPSNLKPTSPLRFTDIAKSAGITFVQDSTTSEQKYYLETMGTGVGWIDYNQDGLLDLFFVQSGATDAYKPDHPL